jgi:superfamily II DNA/RNA helicase
MFSVERNPPICGLNVDNIRKYGKQTLYLRRNSNTTAQFPPAYTHRRTSLQEVRQPNCRLNFNNESHPESSNQNKAVIAMSCSYPVVAEKQKMEKFKVLGLSDNVLDALAKKGWSDPSEIQEKTIPLLLKGERDIVGQAATGTGKTGAFGLPLIEQLDDTSKAVQAIVLCPTRELAVQVAEEIMSFKGTKKLFVQPIYGGQSYTTQIAALRKGVQIVVGTPGRVRDHIEKGTLKLNSVTHVVLDRLMRC